MKKKVKTILLIVIIVTVGLTICSYFYVGGKEFEKMSQVSDAKEVIIEKEVMNVKGRRIETESQEVILKSTQKEMLKSLFKKSHFAKVLSPTIQYNDLDSYYITVKDNEKGTIFHINLFGGKYLSVVSNFDNTIHSCRLKTLNLRWKSELEEIIVLSDANN